MTGRDAFAPAMAIADAVMREGQVLYPYRADALKNTYRWAFGVVGPRTWAAHRHAEPWWCQAAFLVRIPVGDDAAAAESVRLQVRVRWLRAVRRQRPGADPTADWDEADVWHRDVDVALSDVLASPEVRPLGSAPLAIEGTDGDGPWTRLGGGVEGRVTIRGQARGEWACVHVRVENLTEILGDPPADRRGHVARSLLATHVLLAAEGGVLGSLREPPDGAAEAAAMATGERLWTSLVDDRLALAVPMVLPEPPMLAGASVGNSHDGAEIEEMMALRVRSLTPAERDLARRTDPQAADIVDLFESLDDTHLDLLHARMDPGGGHVVVAGQMIARGSAVRLAPSRRADAMDRLLAGREATVTGVFEDLDGNTHVVVTVDDDPGADLLRTMGRGFHFSPDEIVPRDGVSP